MLSFYMDHHVFSSITRGLRERGIDVLTAEEDGRAEWQDEPLLERATELDRVVFTMDDDFLTIAQSGASVQREFPGVIDAHQLGITIGQAIRHLELVAHVVPPEEIAGRIVYLPISKHGSG